MNSGIRVSVGFCIFLALMILLVPLQWVMAMVVAAAIHECCHYAAIRFFSRTKIPLRLACFGASMVLPPLTRGKEVLCALAGPAGSLLLLVLVHRFPRLAICGVLQGLWNLLPVYPLDGGRVLAGLLAFCFSPPIAQRISLYIETLVGIVLLAVGIYISLLLRLGLLPLSVATTLLFRILFRKTPCKAAHLGVQ